MNLGRAMKLVLGDIADAFSLEHARTWFVLGSSTVLMIAFWYLATPGPLLLGFAPRDLATAVSGVGTTVATLLLAPALLHVVLGGNLADLGLRRGDARFGLAAVAALGAIGAFIMILSSGPSGGLQSAYPWPGAQAALSPVVLVFWAVVYSLYYLSFEFFFRGFLMRSLAPAVGPSLALWLQAVAATLVHLGKPLPEVFAALPASLLFGVLALRSRSILYPALLHLVIGLSLDVAILVRNGAFG